MDRYAVIGNPIAHSKSPWIHAAFARQTGQALRYEALLAPLDGFARTVAEFRAHGGRGLNVTVPFKLEAFALAERAGDAAGRRELLAVLDRQRKEVLAGLHLVLGHHGDQHHGIRHVHHDGAIGLAGDFPGFQAYGVFAELKGFLDGSHVMVPLLIDRAN